MEKPSILKKIDDFYTKATKAIIGDVPHDGDIQETPSANKKLSRQTTQTVGLKDKLTAVKDKLLHLGTPDEKTLLYKEVVKREKQEAKEAIKEVKPEVKAKKTVAQKPSAKKKSTSTSKTKTSATKKSTASKKTVAKKPATKTSTSTAGTTKKSPTKKTTSSTKVSTKTSTATTKKTVTKKPTVKSTTTKKVTTNKKAPVKKTTSATSTTTKTTKKTVSKKTVTKATTPTAKKSPTKKVTSSPKATTSTTKAKTATAKKTVTNTTKKTIAKKPTTKKTPAKKTTLTGGKRADKIALYIKDIKKHYGEVDEDFVAIIVKNLGPSIYKKDAESVACSDPKELDTVRKNFLMKKLQIDASRGVLDAAIQDVCEELKATRTKYRATFYYALAKKFKKESVLS